jgi:putative Mn2+ efflux pump MntP
MGEVANQELDRADFERVVAVLEREQEAMKLTRGQRISYRLYTIFIFCFILCLFGAIISAIFLKDNEPSRADKLLVVCIVLAMICLVGGVVSLLLNLPLLYKIVRQRMAIRRMGFSEASSALWKAQRHTQRWRVILRRVGLAVAILAFAVGVAIAFAGIGKKGGSWSALGLGVLFVMMYALSRGKAWLDMMSAQGTDAEKLKDALLSLRKQEGGADAASIAVPSDAIREFSRIESEQIARSRVNAIADSANASKVEFSILSSNDVRKMKAELTPDDRLKVEEAFDALMLQPKPLDAKPDAATGFLRLKVNGTELELVYAVDDTARQLKVVSLGQSEVGSAAHA